MKILKCIICDGEIKVLSKSFEVEKKVKCLCCGFTNVTFKKEPVIIYKGK